MVTTISLVVPFITMHSCKNFLLVMRTSKISLQLSNMQCSLNYSQHAIPYLPTTYLFDRN